MVLVARDVAEQARYEAERAELRDRLTQSEKLAALGQFVAGIAHELNNPLQGVMGHVELMLHGASQLQPRTKRDLKLVFREADRAAKIVHNLLLFAGSRAHQPARPQHQPGGGPCARVAADRLRVGRHRRRARVSASKLPRVVGRLAAAAAGDSQYPDQFRTGAVVG